MSDLRSATCAAAGDGELKTEAFPESVTLSDSQYEVLQTIMQGHSVFCTGAAGTGKSFIMRILQESFRSLRQESKIAFTAPTGVAACNISGLTIHAWAGIGLGVGDTEVLVEKVRKNKYARDRWRTTALLVIDEVSMLSAEMFDKLNVIGQRLRNQSALFGGLQLVLCGDFLQLPPIGIGKTSQFAFQSDSWRAMFPATGAQQTAGDKGSEGTDTGIRSGNRMIVLQKIFRQKDPFFLNVVNEIRVGRVSAQTDAFLRRKCLEDAGRQLTVEAPLPPSSSSSLSSLSHTGAGAGAASSSPPVVSIPATRLFSVNRDVDEVNQSELRMLDPLINDASSGSKISGGGDAGGVPVVTGTLRFKARDEGSEPFLSQLKSGVRAPETVDLCIGAQVMLLKNLDTSIGLVNGSRGRVVKFVRAQDGGKESFNDVGSTANAAGDMFPLVPVVEFYCTLGDTVSVVRQKVMAATWEVAEGDMTRAWRTQMPLALAWAVSIHKAQGMTLPFLEVSFQSMFEFGQAYVSVSRATNLEGLILRHYDGGKIRTHEAVRRFYESIEAVGAGEVGQQCQGQRQGQGQGRVQVEDGRGSGQTVTVRTAELVSMFSALLGDRRGGGGRMTAAKIASGNGTGGEWIDPRSSQSAIPEAVRQQQQRKRAAEHEKEGKKLRPAASYVEHCPLDAQHQQRRWEQTPLPGSSTGGDDSGLSSRSSGTAPKSTFIQIFNDLPKAKAAEISAGDTSEHQEQQLRQRQVSAAPTKTCSNIGTAAGTGAGAGADAGASVGQPRPLIAPAPVSAAPAPAPAPVPYTPYAPVPRPAPARAAAPAPFRPTAMMDLINLANGANRAAPAPPSVRGCAANGSSAGGGGGGVSEEQRRKIEANRQAALQKMQENRAIRNAMTNTVQANSGV